MSYQYIPNNKYPLVPEPNTNTTNKAGKLLPKLWTLLDEYNAIIPGDSEQEVSSIVIDFVYFNWLDDRDRIKIVIRGYHKGDFINED